MLGPSLAQAFSGQKDEDAVARTAHSRAVFNEKSFFIKVA
jgi:hypothetical protein